MASWMSMKNRRINYLSWEIAINTPQVIVAALGIEAR